MFIQTEETPNPATLKFLPGRVVLERGNLDIPSAEQAAPSPLAQRLFAIEGVTGVFLGSDFVTVTKADGADWQMLSPQVLGGIVEHYNSGQPVLDPSVALETDAAGQDDGSDGDLVSRIKELLDTRVRPAVAQDGGDIVFDRFEDGVVFLHMRGSCHGCPSSTMTLKMGIERLLKHFIPEVQEVRAAS